MNPQRTIQALNELLAIEYRSLPMYLTDATPWTHPGDEKASQALEHIVVDQRETCRRVAEMILDRGGGAIDVGEFPMEFTDTHFLSLDFLLKELVTYQKVIVGKIERIVAVLTDDRPVRELAQEALGSERQHLESLEELVRQPAPSRPDMRLVDTHAHLDQDDFDVDRAEVIARASAAGIERIIAVGTTAASSRKVVELAAQYDLLWPAVGIQPNYCAQAAADDWDQIVRLASDLSIVALGETGLDRHWDYAPFDVQQDYFDRHLRLSQTTGLPFIVHTRESDADVLAMLRDAARRGPLTGVMHSFTGTAETAAECVALGLHISFAGMVTFKKSDALRAVAATVPPDRLLIETDSPYLSPHPLRGTRNEPNRIVHTAACLAAAGGEPVEAFAERTSENALKLFGRRKAEGGRRSG